MLEFVLFWIKYWCILNSSVITGRYKKRHCKYSPSSRKFTNWMAVIQWLVCGTESSCSWQTELVCSALNSYFWLQDRTGCGRRAKRDVYDDIEWLWSMSSYLGDTCTHTCIFPFEDEAGKYLLRNFNWKLRSTTELRRILRWNYHPTISLY